MSPKGSRTIRAVLLPIALALQSCGGGPQPIRVGEDTCAFCLMGIAQARFAAELVTRRGRVHTFDSIECMAAFANGKVEEGEVGTVWVTDYLEPPSLLDATKAAYLRSDAIRSPMGLGLAAFASASARDSVLRADGGEPLDWAAVRDRVRSAWPTGVPGMHRHGMDSTAAMPGAMTETATSQSLAERIANAAPGARIDVPPGTYREPTVVIDKPLELRGNGAAILDGEGERGLIVVRSDDVTIRGLVLRNVGTSYMEDRAAIRVENASRCRLVDNRIEDAFFAIYLAKATDCLVQGNRIRSHAVRESSSGNGIHLWYSRGITIRDNVIRGHRDGIYFEFAQRSRVEDNVSEDNVRYGMHFMFSDSSVYRRNLFRRNGAGVAVMYTTHVDMEDNRFLDNWGSATYGLLLKDIRDATITGNRFERNSIGLYAEGSDRIRVARNAFIENGWALKLMSNCDDDRFEANDFIGNTFDVATNSRRTESDFTGNYWDAYRGYDLDRDGVGDITFRPVRLFSLLVEQNEPSLILLRSFLVGLLDAAEAVVPALTPDALVDTAPAMRPLGHAVPAEAP
ncbi:MAG: nitrous oxide reductase family maturation protein NosD [Gemmatimonadota bacterium]|jgi:nitrous oxidase accessory protein